MRGIQLVLAAVLLGTISAASAELTVEEYVDLSIARLEMLRSSWTPEGQVLDEQAHDALCAFYAVTSAEYYRFGSVNRLRISDYLKRNRDLVEQIENLQQELRVLVEQAEAQ